MATFTRQPFGDISTPRLQALGSSKNRQNAISPRTPSLACPLKPSATLSIGKRQREPDIFEDDCENTDPAAFSSPTKKPRSTSHVSAKPARSSMGASPARSSVSLTASPATSVPSIRNSLSSPNTAKSTPISHSRGSPKNKRLHAVSKRRASTSPFRRIDPPSFSQPALPFSIDAALSGTISNYTPKSTATLTATPTATATPARAPQQASALDESMPNSWFFDIHEDTAEQEAANLMEHSASVLDISSGDDAATKARIDELAKGKENVPPPDFALAQPRTALANAIDDGEETEIEEPVKRPRMRKITQDAMDEDRRPLGDLLPSEFYGAGCDASSYVTVDAGIERPSRLSKEIDIESTSENVDPVKKVAVQCAPAGEGIALAAEHVGEGKSEEALVTSPEVITLPENGASTAPGPTSEPVEAASEEQ